MSEIVITEKQRLLAQIVAEHRKKGKPFTKHEVLQKAGYSESTAHTHPSKPFNSQGFKAALKQTGITPNKVAKAFNDALEANTVVVYKGEAHETDAPDNRIRLDAAKTLGKYAGLDKQIIETRNLTINAEADVKDLQNMLGLEE